MKRSLRRDLPFRRIAVILAGGGALGAYETGVLRALGRVGLDPAIVAGASAGALNAVCWVAADLRTEALEGVWRRIEPATIGMHWGTLAWRTTGAFLVLLGGFEMFLSIIGSPELNFASWLDAPGLATVGRGSALLDAIAWAAVMVAGILVVRGSRETEDFLAWASGSGRGRLAHDGLAIVLVIWVIVHIAIWILAIPWPHRFSATLFAAALVLWLASKPGHVGVWVRTFFSRLLPESRGRGLWGDAARREVLEDLVTQGSPDRLTKGPSSS
jgi:Patatin-like phospholipase